MCKEKKKLISNQIQNCGYIMLRAFINLKSMKHLSNSLISMSITTKHWALIYAMDAKKTSLNTS
jgi:hypothetical protein